MPGHILSRYEQAWRDKYFRGINESTGAEHRNAATQSFDRFVRVLRRYSLALKTPPPPTLAPYISRKGADLQRMTYCLEAARKKEEQIDLLPDVPCDMQEIHAIFDAGFSVADKNLLYHRSVHNDSARDLIGALSYARTKVAAHRYLATHEHRLAWPAYKQFFSLLETPRKETEEEFEESERCVLVKIAILASVRETRPERLLVLVERARELKAQLGTTAWQAIFRVDRLRTYDVRRLVLAAEILIDLDGAVDTTPLLHRFAREPAFTLGQLQRALLLERRTYLDATFPEPDLETTLAAFGQPGVDVQVPLSADDLRKVRASYECVVSAARVAHSMSMAQIKEKADEINAVSRSGRRPSRNDRMLLIAMLRESVRRTLGIQPYNTQVLVMLALLTKPEALSGRIAQVKTGEGKSTIVAMTAAYLAVTNHLVDIVSSARPLAIRDQEKYAEFFETVGISSSHICVDRPQQENFAGRIVYGTNTDFEFSLLREGLWGERVRNGRPCDTVIVDEVDNLFIDQGLNNAIIGAGAADPEKWTVPAIVDFAHTASMEDLQAISDGTASVDRLRHFLEEYEDARFASRAAHIDAFHLRRWVASYLKAYEEYEVDEDYVVRPADPESQPTLIGKNVIAIVDRDTGQLSPASRWENRVHQFVEHRHGLDVQDDIVTAAELSHPIFFARYRHIFGVTGTIGGDAERLEIRTVYQTDTFDVPSHRASQRTPAGEPILCNSKADYHAELLRQVEKMRSGDRPSLVLLETIRETNEFSEYLRGQVIAHQLLNAVQTEDEAFIIARAGRPRMVTVATNAAGRGTDILLMRESREAGGLHVLLGFYPENSRIELQGLGRAGRQAQPGSGAIVVNIEELPQETLQHPEGLAGYRREQEAARSAKRVALARVAAVHNEIMEDFFSKISIWRDALGDSFMSRMNAKLTNAQRPRGLDDASEAQSGEQRELLLLMRSVPTALGNETHFIQWLQKFRATMDARLIERWSRFFDGLKDDAEMARASGSAEACAVHAVLSRSKYALFCAAIRDFYVNPEFAFEAALDAALR